MTDSFAPIEATSNGSLAGKDEASPLVPGNPPEPLFSRSVEDRLDTLMETVRTWDWRQMSGGTRREPPLVQDLSVPVASPETRPAEPPVVSPPAGAPADTSVGETAFEPERPASTIVTGDTTISSGDVAQDEPTSMVSSGDVTTRDGSLPSPASFGVPLVVPEADRTSQREAKRETRRSRTRKRIMVLAAVLVAVLAVGGIIEGIRLATKSSSGSAGPSTTPSTVVHRHAAAQAPIDAAKLTRYEGYAAGLEKANEAATRGFVAAGSTPSSAQVAGIVTAYRSALNLYDFQLHFIEWPGSMLTAVATDHAQLQALMSFLQSFPTISPTGVSAWLTQLHNRTGSTAAADNLVRNDLGLSNSAAWP